MKVRVKSWHAIAEWRWDIGQSGEDADGEEDVCGICRVPYEGCCPSCKMPGDDCPLMWGECSHVFHMHCIIKWLGTQASKQQCPMDRRPWVTAAQRKAAPEPETATSNAPPEQPSQYQRNPIDTTSQFDVNTANDHLPTPMSPLATEDALFSEFINPNM